MTEAISSTLQSVQQDYSKIERNQSRIKSGKITQIAIGLIGIVAIVLLVFAARGAIHYQAYKNIFVIGAIGSALFTSVGMVVANIFTRYFKAHKKMLESKITGERLLEAISAEPQVFLKPKPPLPMNEQRWIDVMGAAAKSEKVNRDVLQILADQPMYLASSLLRLTPTLLKEILNEMTPKQKEDFAFFLDSKLELVLRPHLFQAKQYLSRKNYIAFRRSLKRFFGGERKIDIKIFESLKELTPKAGQLVDIWKARKNYFNLRRDAVTKT